MTGEEMGVHAYEGVHPAFVAEQGWLGEVAVRFGDVDDAWVIRGWSDGRVGEIETDSRGAVQRWNFGARC